MGELAADLSVTDVRATSGWSLRRTGRQASATRRLPHAHRTPRPISYRHARAAQLGDGLNSSLTFCWRGLRIMGGDIAESAGSCKRWFKARARRHLLTTCYHPLPTPFQERKIQPAERAHIRRTLVDIIALVPYSIIMIIPLSPPGHVFAFSVLNR